MKRLDDQAAGPGFDVDPAHGTESHPPPRFEPMEQSPLHAGLHELLLKRPENLLLHCLQLEAGLVTGSPATFHPVASLPGDPVREQPPLVWQWLGETRGDLGEGQPILPPSHQMARRRDRDRRGVASAIDRPRRADLEEFGMEAPAIELKHQLANFWSQGYHARHSCTNNRRSVSAGIRQPDHASPLASRTDYRDSSPRRPRSGTTPRRTALGGYNKPTRMS